MGSRDESIEIDALERQLLHGCASNEYNDADEDSVFYSASFTDMKDNFVKYQIAEWVLYSLLLIFAWGIGVFMLLYLPVRRCVLLEDFCSRKLYVTQNAIVYKVKRPVVFPCFGVLKKEKHVLLASVADIVVEQGYLQSFFGVHSIRIENIGVKRPANDDVQIQGIDDPMAFREAVLSRLSTVRSEGFRPQSSLTDNSRSFNSGSWNPAYGNMILQKLEEVWNSVKKVQVIVEKQTSTSVS